MGEEDEAFDIYAQTAEQSNSNLLNLAVMRYSLTYGGVEMDLSNCEIEVTVAPTMQMQAMAAEYEKENPVDNGDDDGDGYVLGADGVNLLPAPEVKPEILLSLVTPAAPDAEKPVVYQDTIELEGAAATAAPQLVQAAYAAEAETPAADISTSPEEDAMPGTEADSGPNNRMVEVSMQSVSASIAQAAGMPGGTDAAELGNTIAVQTDTPVYPTYTVQYYETVPEIVSGTQTNASSLGRLDAGTWQKTLNVKSAIPDGDKFLLLIDTSGNGDGTGGHRPHNYSSKVSSRGSAADHRIMNPATDNDQLKFIALKTVGGRGQVMVKETLLPTYRQETYDYLWRPAVMYADKLIKIDKKELQQIWVLKEGRDPESTDESDWFIYDYQRDGGRILHFTNRDGDFDARFQEHTDKNGGPIYRAIAEDGSYEEYICILNEAVLRFVYATDAEKTQDFAATFYDYDITDGKIYKTAQNAQKRAGGVSVSNQSIYPNQTWYVNTYANGINAESNYIGGGAHLAFGNGNTGTRWGKESIAANGIQYLINQQNSDAWGTTNRGYYGYMGCSFRLAADTIPVDANGNATLQYSSGITAPKLFNEPGNVTGKTTYGGYTLTFLRATDTFTLSAVKDAKSSTVAGNLDTFSYYNDGQIQSNDFWPMDNAPSYGTNGHDFKSGSDALASLRKYQTSVAGGAMPGSDDKRNIDHNSYFGMQFAVNFEMTEDYIGPLNYYFFGDDDMWVYLQKPGAATAQLICDIGGVHSSAGEYVNLWDYIKIHDGPDQEGTYKLFFYFTERGATGSTCWMQFTLPNASTDITQREDGTFGELRIDKNLFKVTDNGATVTADDADTGETFRFRLDLKTAGGRPLPDRASALIFRPGEKTTPDAMLVWDGIELNLKDDEYIIVRYLEEGTRFTVTELPQVYPAGQATPALSSYNYTTNVWVGLEDRVEQPNIQNVQRKYFNRETYHTPGTTEGVSAPGVGGTVLANQEMGVSVSGEIIANKQVTVLFENRYNRYLLPETGGMPSIAYTGAGAVLVMLAAVVYTQRRRKKTADTSAE